MDKKNLFKRIVLFCLGMAIIQLGVALSLVTNIGSDCFTVFTQGVSRVLNTTPGYANMAILFVYICIILFVDRKYIKIGTFICLIGVGPLIDFLISMCSILPIADANIIIKCIVIILANVIVAIGFSILSATNLGVAPNDIIAFLLRDKTKFQYKWIRMTIDFSYLIIGFMLGGIVGIGTIISALILGQVIQFFLPYGDKLVNGTKKEESLNEVVTG